MVDLTKLALGPERLDDRPIWNTRPLVEEEQADQYPVHVLPPVIRDAVREVQGWVKAPTALVAASALSAVSAVAQSLFSVRRNTAMEGPATLYMLTVAGSGERKSTVDKQFMAPIKEWQAAQRREHKRAVAEYKLDLAAWEANRPQSDNRDELLGHELGRPEEPRERRLLRGDDTAEALVIALQNFPSAAVISDEVGVIFGSYSMKAENVVASLAQINILWDGGTIHQERVKRDPVHVEGPRVTMGLMVQPEVLEGFVQNTGGLAKGIGYFARFLFTHP